MTKFYWDELTSQMIENYAKKPSQAILLEGSAGAGLKTLAMEIAHSCTAYASDIEYIAPDEKRTISIATIRQLYVSTRDIQVSPRCYIIDDADAMSFDAQNAFLKLLEEPTAQTFFILTTHSSARLLDTIRSRVQKIPVGTISSQHTSQLLDDLKIDDEKVRTQIRFIAEGLPAEITRLATEPGYFEERSSLVKQAQSFLSSRRYDRLVLVAGLSDRTKAIDFVDSIAHIAGYMLRKKEDSRLHAIAKHLETTKKRLLANGNVKLQLAWLAIKLG